MADSIPYILIVDDELSMRELLEYMLGREGYRVDCAENGKEGVEKFMASAPGYYGAIFMDIRMPVMDGIEAAKAIRSLERPDAKTIPIVALTANAFEDDKRECFEAGMNAHVAKPIDFEKLFETLSSLLGR